jgi:oligopeptide transport system substrate-binding protein
MHFHRRWVLGGAGTAVAVAALAWPRPDSGALHLSTGSARIFHRGNAAEPATLDPHKASTVWEDWIMGDMFVGLMHQDPQGNPIPAACESLTASADGLTYIVKLREHNWSDGTPVTADDYVYSFRRIADPKTAAQYVSILFPIYDIQAAVDGKVKPEDVGVRALDERTLEIRLLFQVPYMDQLLMHQTTYAVPRHIVEKHGDDWLNPRNIVTNGPFVLREWVPNEHILVVKNPHFFAADTVKFDQVYFYPTEDTAAALKRFRAGALDIVNRCPSTTEVARLRKTMPREIKIAPFVATYYLAVNQTRAPFSDVRVRQALAMAIDRETLVDKVLRVGQIAAYNVVPPGMPHYPYSGQARFRTMPMQQRLERAKALLSEAGFGPGNPLTFDFSTYNTLEAKLTAVALQAMWQTAGVDMHIRPIDSQILFDTLRKRDFAVAHTGWIADYRDPKNFMFLFQSSSPDLNYGGYSNAEFDNLVANSDHIRDPQARLQTLADAEQILMDDVGTIPLMHDVTRDMVSPQVKGWIPNVTNFNRSRWLSLDRSIQSA